MKLLPMNSGLFYLSPIGILLGVINRSYGFGLLVMLAIDCPQKLVARCSQNPEQTSVSF
jgi:hypothetical protein